MVSNIERYFSRRQRGEELEDIERYIWVTEQRRSQL